MLSGRQLHGLAVINSSNGRELGRVTDVLASYNGGKVAGFVISGSNVLARTFYLPAEKIISCDLSGIRVENMSALKKLPQPLPASRLAEWRGCSLLDTAGTMRGCVSDIMVNRDQVCGLEISAGILADLNQRRKYVPLRSVQPANGAFMQIDDHLT